MLINFAFIIAFDTRKLLPIHFYIGNTAVTDALKNDVSYAASWRLYFYIQFLKSQPFTKGYINFEA